MRYHEIIAESTTVRLTDLYDEQELDDPREALHVYVDEEDLEKAFVVHEMSPEQAKTYVTPRDDMTVFDSFCKFAGRDQKHLVQAKINAYDSSRIIVVFNLTVLDGNHQLVAGIMAKKPIKYINLAD